MPVTAWWKMIDPNVDDALGPPAETVCSDIPDCFPDRAVWRSVECGIPDEIEYASVVTGMNAEELKLQQLLLPLKK